jgi:pimeloyl-ACP methyl ester carboxylesterase
MQKIEAQFHLTVSGQRMAYHQQLGDAQLPGVVFLCGYRSDMESTKATALAEFCAAQNITFTRFDYFGHGKSEGEFKDFTIGSTIAYALEVLDHIATGPQILVGSSMGGWAALQVARERKGQVRGIIGVAAAPDFTDKLMFSRMSPEQRKTLADDGVIWVYSDFTSSEYFDIELAVGCFAQRICKNLRRAIQIIQGLRKARDKTPIEGWL